MNRYVFDLEADGLYQEATKIHCIVVKDIDLNDTYKYYGCEGEVKEGVDRLLNADLLVGHNIINFDLALIEKLYGKKFKGELFDTLVVSRLLNPDRRGGHSLDSWGQRVGRYKPSHEDWSVFTPEMLHRCEEDVEINDLVYKILLKEIG